MVQISEKPPAVQKAIFLNAIGTEAFRIYKTLHHPAGMEQDELETVMATFEAYAKSYTNVIYERYLFNSRSQEPSETLEEYIRVLKDLASTCDYPITIRQELIRDRIVSGMRDNQLHKRLLREKKLTLPATMDMCRDEQATLQQVKGIAGDSASNPIEVNAVREHAPAAAMDPKLARPLPSANLPGVRKASQHDTLTRPVCSPEANIQC